MGIRACFKNEKWVISDRNKRNLNVKELFVDTVKNTSDLWGNPVVVNQISDVFPNVETAFLDHHLSFDNSFRIQSTSNLGIFSKLHTIVCGYTDDRNLQLIHQYKNTAK